METRGTMIANRFKESVQDGCFYVPYDPNEDRAPFEIEFEGIIILGAVKYNSEPYNVIDRTYDQPAECSWLFTNKEIVDLEISIDGHDMTDSLYYEIKEILIEALKGLLIKSKKAKK